jgi:hypothetical protein
MANSVREMPQFKYHPDPLGNRVIVERQCVCPVCNEVTGFAYEGPSYSIEDVENLSHGASQVAMPPKNTTLNSSTTMTLNTSETFKRKSNCNSARPDISSRQSTRGRSIAMITVLYFDQ